MARLERKAREMLETILIVLILGVFGAGVVALVVQSTRERGRLLVAETRLLQAQLVRVGELTGLSLHQLEILDNDSRSEKWPLLPVLYGVQGGYSVLVSPGYWREFTGEYDYPVIQEHPFLVRVLASDPEGRFRMTPDIRPQSRDDLAQIWETLRPQPSSWGMEVSDRAGGEHLMDRKRRPLRLNRLRRSSTCLEAEVEFVDPGKAKVEGETIRNATDPEDLARILRDLIAIADHLALRSR